MSRALGCADQRLMASPLRQTSHSAGHWRFLPPFFFCGCWCNFFSPPPSTSRSSGQCSLCNTRASESLQPIRFQVDSGASCNVLRFEDMQSLNKKVALTSTERSLQMYDGSVTKPLGMFVLSVKNPRTSVKRELEFMIMRQAPVSLLGCAAS